MTRGWQDEDLHRTYLWWWALMRQRLRLVRLLRRRGEGRPAPPTPDVKSGASVPPPSRRAAPSGGHS